MFLLRVSDDQVTLQRIAAVFLLIFLSCSYSIIQSTALHTGGKLWNVSYKSPTGQTAFGGGRGIPRIFHPFLLLCCILGTAFCSLSTDSFYFSMSSLLFVSYIKILSTSSNCVFISVIYSWSLFIYSCSRLITLCSYLQDALHFYIFENFKHTYFKCRMLSYLYFVICEFFLYMNLLTVSHGKDFLTCFIIFQSSIHLSKVSQFQRWYFYQHLQHLS